MRFGRPQLVEAMWEMFGTRTAALLHADAPVIQQLNNPTRVMLDVLYGANGPLTLVANSRAVDSRRDSAKLSIEDGSWIWSTPAVGASEVRLAEYNPVNTINQQNGIGCAFAAADAVATSPSDAASLYAVDRKSCPKRREVTSDEPKCAINDAVCGGQGDGAARETTKPRLSPRPGQAPTPTLCSRTR